MPTRLIALLMTGCLLVHSILPAAALTYINNTQTIYTNGTLTYNDSFQIGPSGNVSFVDSGGVHGGSVVINVPNGGYFQVDSGGILSLNALVSGGNGGSLIVNQLGTGNATINGTIRANGLGSGSGGVITINGNNLSVGNNAVIQALGGSSGLGGTINLTETGGVLSVGSNATISTNGLSDATHNLITIQGSGVTVDGQVNANGILNGSGGKLTIVATNGQIKLTDAGDFNARGAGTGTGGTIAIRAHKAGQTFDVDNCGNTTCTRAGDTELLVVANNARFNVAGGSANNGTLEFGRAGAGDINQNGGKFNNNQFQGAGTVLFGNDGYTTNITYRNFDLTGDFNGSQPVMTFVGSGNITATNSNNFNTVSATSTGGGTISITDSTGGMTVNGLSTSGTSTLIAANTGAITLNNATASGTVNVQTDGTIGGSGNTLTGSVNLMGKTGTGDRAGAVNFANNTSLNLGRLRSTSATITTNGASSDMTLANVNVTGATTLNSGRDIDASATTNSFGTTTAASGRNINLYNNANAFVLNGVNATGALTLANVSGQNMTLTSVTSGTGTNISTSGGGDISGSTGNVFGGTTSITTNTDNGGHITLTADFQGNTTLYGDEIDVTDTAGDFTVTGFQNGATGISTVTATGSNANVDIAVTDLKAGGAAKLLITAPKNIRITKTTGAWGVADDTTVANSTNGGNITLESFNINSPQSISGRTTAWDVNTATAGLWVSTNGGNYTLNSLDVGNRLDIVGTGSVTGTGNTLRGAVDINAGSGAISLTSSDFQSTTENDFVGGNITLADNAGGLTVTTLTASGTASLTTSGATPTLTVSNANVTGNTTLASGSSLTATSNNNFGTLTASASGNISLTEQGTININTLTNSGGAATTTLVSANGSILGKGTASTDVTVGSGALTVTAGDAAGDTSSEIDLNVSTGGNVTAAAWGNDASSNSIVLRGSVGGNLIARNGSGGATTGHIMLGDSTANLSVTGTTTFNAAGTADVIGVGSYTGAVGGSAGRVAFTVTSGDFTSSGLTASSGSGWFTSDESLIVVARNGDILGSGYTASGAANIRLQAGAWNYQNSAGDINITNLSAAQNVRLFATGKSGSNVSVSVGGTSNVAGHITVTNVNGSNQYAATTGSVNMTLSSGNVNTALIWTNGQDITLTASNGNILQDASVYNFSSMRGNTLTTQPHLTNAGNITLTAQGGTSRYINSGGFGKNITAIATGDTAGNGTGTSVQLFGKAYGNVSVSNTSNGNVTGNVYLGTGLGDPNNLFDVNTVMDIYGTTTVRANGNVYLYGFTGGAVTIIGKSFTAQVDQGNLNIASITTTLNTGTAVSLSALMGNITGGNIDTRNGGASSASVFMQAGSQYPRDNFSNISLNNVSIGGNVNITVTGTTTGTAGSGNSVVITKGTGTGIAGSKNAVNESGGAPRGTVTWPN